MPKEPVLEVILTSTNNHTYIFRYVPSNIKKVLAMLGVMAANKELDFTWSDACDVGIVIRRQIKSISKN